MFQIQIIGHLGANAEVGESNGRKYVKFRVATSKSYRKADGTQVESTQWHSCIMSGDGGGLLPYLVRGQQVFVTGNADLGVVSSPKLKRMVATCDVQVISVELIGGKPEAVPGQLADPDGALHTVYKAYYLDFDEVKGFVQSEPCTFYSSNGSPYQVTQQGFVLTYQQAQGQTENQAETKND